MLDNQTSSIVMNLSSLMFVGLIANILASNCGFLKYNTCKTLVPNYQKGV